MNIDLKRKKEKRNSVIRWLLYGLLLALSYLYMTTAPIQLKTPLFLIPAAMCVSMFEEPFDSALTGCAAGLMLDSALGTIVGINGIIMLWCCLISSLLFHFFVRRFIVNIILLNAAAVIAEGIIHYFFYYAIWGYDPGSRILVREFLPVMLYTELSVVPFYFAVRFLFKRFGIIEETSIEEQSDDIVRE